MNCGLCGTGRESFHMAKQKNWNNYYEIIDELGEGGNAKVYRVKSKEDNKEYALKVFGIERGNKKPRKDISKWEREN